MFVAHNFIVHLHISGVLLEKVGTAPSPPSETCPPLSILDHPKFWRFSAILDAFYGKFEHNVLPPHRSKFCCPSLIERESTFPTDTPLGKKLSPLMILP